MTFIQPAADSLRARALKAFDGAQEVTLYSLRPWQYPESPPAWDRLPDEEKSRREDALLERSRKQWCKRATCFHQQRVLGRTRVAAADLPAVRTAVRQTLATIPDASSLCLPEYRHAVSYVSAGKRYDVLLCYGCGDVEIYQGSESDGGGAWEMGDQRALESILRRAGIALDKPYEEENE